MAEVYRTMTSRERLLTSLRRRVPDRAPVSPDVSNMMPARYTGKPFWEVYVNHDPPSETRIMSTSEEQWVVEEVIHTPKRDLTTTTVYPRE